MILRTIIVAFLALAGLAGCEHLPDAAHAPGDTATTDGPITDATPLPEVVRRRHVEALDPDAPTPLLDQAMAELAKTDPQGRYHGITYDLTRDNTLDRHWLVQTPNIWGRRSSDIPFVPLACHGHCDDDFLLPFCRRDPDCPSRDCGRLHAFDASPELVGRRLCLGLSERLIDRFYQPIIEATATVDITALQPAPDFRFLAALRNAVTMLARSGRAVTLRVLVGQYPPDNTDAQALLRALVRDAKSVPGSRVTVYAAAMRSCTGEASCGSFSWNHSKVVAVDGRIALVGGINMWSADYLLDQPVHDISMQVEGDAAIDAHRFADRLWHWVCHHHDPNAAVASYVFRAGVFRAGVFRAGEADVSPGCPEGKEPSPQASGITGKIPVLATGRLAAGVTKAFANQDDIARDLFFGAARHDIVVAQQDVGFTLPGATEVLYPEMTLEAWARFMLAGRGDVYLVLSNLGAVGRGKNSYSNGVPLAAVAEKMLAVAQAHSTLPRPDLVDLLCRHFHLAPYRFGPDATWPGGGAIGNHGKFWMVDDRFFYIGSDNLYPVDLQEFGYIVDDRAAAAELRRTYWAPLWRWSGAAAISGDDAPTCVLRQQNGS